jgi:predicted O-methyltransferase YrrM
VYSGTDVEPKIRQLFADSKTLDAGEWVGKCDVVFVDGSHAYSYVVADSAKALELLRPGGVVLWHDYAGPKHSPGVYRALNELAERLPLVRLEHTTLAGYRRPHASAAVKTAPEAEAMLRFRASQARPLPRSAQVRW